MSSSQASIKKISLVPSSLRIIGFAILFLILSIGVFFVGLNIWFAGRILPGVYFMDTPLGGLTTQQAQQTIQAHILPEIPQVINLTYQDRIFPTNLLEMGVQLDAARIAEQAFSTGRSGSFAVWSGDLVALLSGNKTLPTVLYFDENMAADTLQEIALQIDQPMIDALITFEGNEVHTAAGQIGRTVDIAASLSLIEDAIRQNDYSSLDLIVLEQSPDILDAEPFAQIIRDFLAADFSLVIPSEYGLPSFQYDLDSSTLAPMLELVKNNHDENITIDLQFKESVLENLLSDLAPSFSILMEEPRFIFNDESGEIELFKNGITGRTLAIADSILQIQQQLAAGSHQADLVFTYQHPSVADNATGTQLGVTELVQQQSTFFYGSSSARVQNIQTAAGRFLGLLVAPGEVFSMADAMGEISLDSGFTEALIIYNGKTIEGVGGGVCQVSTTLFRTAFFAGFPITERHPHAYRVSFYEKTAGNYRDSSLAGLDATVYVPLVDLKFQNDTPYWLLMEAYVYPDSSQIVWKFYSTSDGRTIEWETTGPYNTIEPPEPKYYRNSELDEGEVKQVDWEAEGADIQVDRRVFKNGAFYFQDQFLTHYEAWGAVFEVGPGVDGYPISEE